MKKSVLELTDKDVIHAETKEQAIELCKLFDSLGLMWADNKCYLELNDWEICRQSTCYNPKVGEFSHLNFCNKEGYTIHKATDFISLNNELVEMVVKDCEKQTDLEILKIYLRAKIILAEKYNDSDTANEVIDLIKGHNLI